MMTRPQLWLSFVVVVLWTATLITRAVSPAQSTQFAAVDATVLLVFGYVFSAKAVAKRNGNGHSNGGS